MNSLVLQNKPPIATEGIRSVNLSSEEAEMERRSRFSFAAIDMLKVDPVSKLIFLQEPIIEKRYAQILKVLEESIAFLEGELRKRGIVTEIGLAKLKKEALADTSDLEPINIKSWFPENYNDGDKNKIIHYPQ